MQHFMFKTGGGFAALVLLLISLSVRVETTQAQITMGTTIITPSQSDAYLTNPGIGWQNNPYDDTKLPETVFYQNREETSWDILEPTENNYNWTPIDQGLQRAKNNNLQTSFRVFNQRDYGQPRIPNWLPNKDGGVLTGNGLVDYHNCTYQQEWAEFVEALRQRYDQTADADYIAFIDISGYGLYNEWRYMNEFYSARNNFLGKPRSLLEADASNSQATIDEMARRRLADMFIGGAATIRCEQGGGTQTVSYNYPGFENIQLVMPYAGITQSMYYVFERNESGLIAQGRAVGMRFDCMGFDAWDNPNDSTRFVGRFDRGDRDFEADVKNLYRVAPWVFEMCEGRDIRNGSGQIQFSDADAFLRFTHGNIVHDNGTEEGGNFVGGTLADFMKLAGYRLFLNRAEHDTATLAGNSFIVKTRWQNVGYAPNYPRMGQTLDVVAYLTRGGEVRASQTIAANIQPMPAANVMPGSSDTPPQYNYNGAFLTTGLAPGKYQLEIAVIDRRRGVPIRLPLAGFNQTVGRFALGTVDIFDGNPDVNNDGFVTPADAVFVINRIGQSATGDNAPADINGDNTIDDVDLQAVTGTLGQTR